MIDKIQQLSGWAEMDAEEIATAFAESVQTASNRGLLTHAWVSKNVNPDVAEEVYKAIKSVSEALAMRFAAGIGIDTSVDDWKQKAEAVALAKPELAQYKSALKDFELTTTTRWLLCGGNGSPPTQQAVQAVLDEQARYQQINTWREAFSAAINKYNAGEAAEAAADVLAIATEMDS